MQYGKKKKRYLDGKGISKIVTVAHSMIVYVENCTKKAIRTNKLSKVAGSKVNTQS